MKNPKFPYLMRTVKIEVEGIEEITGNYNGK